MKLLGFCSLAHYCYVASVNMILALLTRSNLTGSLPSTSTAALALALSLGLLSTSAVAEMRIAPLLLLLRLLPSPNAAFVHDTNASEDELEQQEAR